MNLQEFRAKYPEYDDLSDGDLIQGLHDTYYSDIPLAKFQEVMGVQVQDVAGVREPATLEMPEQTYGTDATWIQPETTTTTTVPPEQLQPSPGEPEKVSQSKARINEMVKGLSGTQGTWREPAQEQAPDPGLYDRVLGHEGLRLTKYKDSLGNWTIGVGHKMKPGDPDKIDEATAFQMYEQDMQQAIDGASRVVSVFPKLDPVRQGVLTEMVFQMGETGVKKFKKMNNALENGDYETASKEMLDSKWAKQTPERAQNLAEIMKSAPTQPPEPYDLEGVGLDVGEYSGKKLAKDFAETAGMLTGSMAGATAGGIAGIADLARTTIEEGKPDLESAANAIVAVAKEFEIEVDPNNEIAKLASKPFETLEKIGRAAGDKVLDLTGSAGLATAVYSTVVMSPILGPAAIRKIGGLKTEISAAKTARIRAEGTYEKTIKTTAKQPKLEGRGKPLEGPPPATGKGPEKAPPAPEPGPEPTSPALAEGGKPAPKPKAKISEAEAEIRRAENMGKIVQENRRVYGKEGDDLFTQYMSKGMSAEQARAKVKETLGEPTEEMLARPVEKIPEEEIRQQENLGKNIIENRRIYGQEGDDLFTEYYGKGMSAEEARAKVRETLGEPKAEPPAELPEPKPEGPQPLRVVTPKPKAVAGKATPLKTHTAAKNAVLDAIDKERKTIGDKEDSTKFIRFIDPVTGTEMDVKYTWKALGEFYKEYKKGVTPPGATPPGVGKVSTPTQKAVAGNKENWGSMAESPIVEDGGDLIKVGPYISDGTMVIKTDKIPKGKKISKKHGITEQQIIDNITPGKGSHDAELRYYAVDTESLQGVSATPVPPPPGEESAAGLGQWAVFRDLSTDKRIAFDQLKVNAIVNRYPDATWKFTPHSKGAQTGFIHALDNGEPVAALASVRIWEEGGAPAEAMAKEAGLYNIGEFADTPVIMELPELVQLTRGLMNRDPVLLKAMPPNVRGAFSPFFEAIVLPKYGPAKWGFEQMTKTLAHELGHVIDWLPNKYLGRGNILGRIASMTEAYRKETLPFKKGAPGELTPEDRARLKKEAEKLAKAEGEELIDEEITRLVAVDPDDVLAILKGVEAKGELSPDLVHFIFTASTAVKKSIALQAMKGMSPAELSHLSSIITEKTGKKIKKGADPAAIKAKYEKLLKEEIAKRRLWELGEIEKELKKLSAKWRPYVRGADHKYDAYRDTPEELYADAISALLTSPETLRNNAPKFYEAFFNWVESKPEFSKMWQEIQAKIRGGRPADVTDARLEQDGMMFARASEIANELHKKRLATRESSYDTLMRGLWDSKHPAIHQIRLWEKKGGPLKKVAKNMRWELEEMEYIASEVSQYAYEYDKIFTGPMEETGLTMDDIGALALRKHIAENRQEIFSAQGYTPKTANDDLMEMKAGRAKGWTPEKYEAAVKILNKYRKLREDFIIPLIEDAGLATPELLEIIKDRIWYQKMAVQRFMTKQYGMQGGGRIYKQVGDLGEVKNPLVATYLQDLSLIRAARINIAKRKFYMLGKIEKILEPAKMKWNGVRQAPVKHADPNMEIMTIITRGSAQHFYAPAPIAESFKKEPFMAMQLVGLWNALMRPLRAILVNKNPVWMARNVPRDFTESIKKNPEIGLRHTGKLLKMYAKAWPEVWRDVFKNIRSEDIRTMYKDRMLLTDRVWASHELNFEDEIERMASSFALKEVADKESNWAIARWKKFIRYLDKWGRMSEILSKVAGYKYLKAYTDMPHKEIGHRVRTRIGTPDVKRQGSWQTVTNNLFMFSNVGKEGIRANVEAFRENKGAYIWKTLAINILPKLILAAGAAGIFGTIYGVYHKKEEEEARQKGARYWKMLIDAIPEYDKAMYTIIPLYLDEKYRAHYLRIPQDYEGQYFGALFWKMLNLKIVGENGALSTISNINPYNLNPYLEVGGVVADYYLRGQNPVDNYRGRFVLNDRTMAAGGKYAAKELGKYVWKNLGMSIFYNPEYGDLVRQRDDSENFLRTFPGNILGTFYKISDQGLYENTMDHLRAARKGTAIESLEIDRQLADLTTEEKGLLMNWVAPQHRTKIRKMMQREENSALMRSLASARSKEETLMVLDLFSDQLLYEE